MASHASRPRRHRGPRPRLHRPRRRDQRPASSRFGRGGATAETAGDGRRPHRRRRRRDARSQPRQRQAHCRTRRRHRRRPAELASDTLVAAPRANDSNAVRPTPDELAELASAPRRPRRRRRAQGPARHVRRTARQPPPQRARHPGAPRNARPLGHRRQAFFDCSRARPAV